MYKKNYIITSKLTRNQLLKNIIILYIATAIAANYKGLWVYLLEKKIEKDWDRDRMMRREKNGEGFFLKQFYDKGQG